MRKQSETEFGFVSKLPPQVEIQPAAPPHLGPARFSVSAQLDSYEAGWDACKIMRRAIYGGQDSLALEGHPIPVGF